MVIGFNSQKSAFKAAVDGYIASAMQALGINSPSKVFMEIGDYTAEGYNIGFGRTIDGNVPIPKTGATIGGDLGAQGDTQVKVFIGDQELTDIVDVQVEKSTMMGRDFAVAGRRDY